MRGSATLRDVARLAGVSLGTASHALNNKSNVLPETRARVLEAASTLGYQPPQRANGAKGSPLSVVGMLVRLDNEAPMLTNPFYSYVLTGAERECARRNLSLMYANIEVDKDNRPVSWPRMLDEASIDGILIVGTFLIDTLDQIRQRTVRPIVLVDAYAFGNPFDSVITDNLTGAYNAVTYLIEKGHRDIGLLGSLPNAYPSISERRKGYTRALKVHGIAATYIEDTLLLRDAAYEGTRKLLARSPQITAIFACNDQVAFGVMDAAREMGRRIPDDLSIVGFDDIDLSQSVQPALTTVHVDKTLMGAMGIRHLLDRAEDPDRSVLTTVVSTRLVERSSVCAR